MKESGALLSVYDLALMLVVSCSIQLLVVAVGQRMRMAGAAQQRPSYLMVRFHP